MWGVFVWEKKLEELILNKKESVNKADCAIHILLVFLAGVYPLLLFELNFESFAIQHLVLFLCVMGAVLYCVLLMRSGNGSLPCPEI